MSLSVSEGRRKKANSEKESKFPTLPLLFGLSPLVVTFALSAWWFVRCLEFHPVFLSTTATQRYIAHKISPSIILIKTPTLLVVHADTLLVHATDSTTVTRLF